MSQQLGTPFSDYEKMVSAAGGFVGAAALMLAAIYCAWSDFQANTSYLEEVLAAMFVACLMGRLASVAWQHRDARPTTTD